MRTIIISFQQNTRRIAVYYDIDIENIICTGNTFREASEIPIPIIIYTLLHLLLLSENYIYALQILDKREKRRNITILQVELQDFNEFLIFFLFSAVQF